MHAALRREVVSRRRGVGRGRDQHVVFEERDARAAVQPRAADADVRPEAEAVFFLHVDAGHGSQDAHDVALQERLQFLLADHVGGAGDVLDRSLVTDDRHLVDVGAAWIVGHVAVVRQRRCRYCCEEKGTEESCERTPCQHESGPCWGLSLTAS